MTYDRLGVLRLPGPLGDIPTPADAFEIGVAVGAEIIRRVAAAFTAPQANPARSDFETMPFQGQIEVFSRRRPTSPEKVPATSRDRMWRDIHKNGYIRRRRR